MVGPVLQVVGRDARDGVHGVAVGVVVRVVGTKEVEAAVEFQAGRVGGILVGHEREICPYIEGNNTSG